MWRGFLVPPYQPISVYTVDIWHLIVDKVDMTLHSELILDVIGQD